MKISIGHSIEPDTQSAVKEILAECKKSLKDSKPQAGLLFASIGYDFNQIIEEIEKEYPGIKIAGCSSFGEISSGRMLEQNSAALILFSSEEIPVTASFVSEVSENEKEKTYNALKQSLQGMHPTVSLVFADGINSNISDIILGLKEYYGNQDVVVGGGGACDDWQFKEVFLFSEEGVKSKAASILTFCRPMKASIAVRHGRSPLNLNKKFIVTKSDRNVLYTVNDQTALDFYKENLGEYANYEAYALIIYLDDPDKFPNKYLIRAPFKIDKENGSITFPGDIPQNSCVGISQLSTQERTLEAARECVKQACATFSGKRVDLALVFSCALRKEIMGTDTYKELDIIKEELPPNTPFFGYYTYGEIGSINLGDPINYFNETIVIVLLGE